MGILGGGTYELIEDCVLHYPSEPNSIKNEVTSDCCFHYIEK